MDHIAPHTLYRYIDALCVCLFRGHQSQTHSHTVGKIPGLAVALVLWSAHGVSAMEFFSPSWVALTCSQATDLWPCPFRNPPPGCSWPQCGTRGENMHHLREHGVRRHRTDEQSQRGCSSQPCSSCESPLRCLYQRRGRAGTPGPGEGFSMLCFLPLLGMGTLWLSVKPPLLPLPSTS